MGRFRKAHSYTVHSDMGRFRKAYFHTDHSGRIRLRKARFHMKRSDTDRLHRTHFHSGHSAVVLHILRFRRDRPHPVRSHKRHCRRHYCHIERSQHPLKPEQSAVRRKKYRPLRRRYPVSDKCPVRSVSHKHPALYKGRRHPVVPDRSFLLPSVCFCRHIKSRLN